MYDYPELASAHEALWKAVAARLTAAGVNGVPQALTRTLAARQVWKDPHLLLGQGCEYPLAKSFADSVTLVASPAYRVPGCEGARYRSAIVVREGDPARTLRDLRHRRCVVNETDSNSGMNLLRAAVAPLAEGSRFFESVATSGSHRHSAGSVVRGAADVAALDCVSYAHFRRLYPAEMAGLRVLAWTDPCPSLPYITARATDRGTLEALRTALAAVITDPALGAVRDELLLGGFDLDPEDDYAAVLRLERRAAEQGYPALV